MGSVSMAEEIGKKMLKGFQEYKETLPIEGIGGIDDKIKTGQSILKAYLEREKESKEREADARRFANKIGHTQMCRGIMKRDEGGIFVIEPKTRKEKLDFLEFLIRETNKKRVEDAHHESWLHGSW